MELTKSSRVVAAVATACVLAACGSSSSGSGGSGGSTGTGGTSSASSGKHYTIGYILAADIPALESQAAGAKIAAQKYHMGFVEQSANFSPDQQLSAMSALISKHVNAIITSPLVLPSFETLVKKAVADGIKVITYDGEVPGITANVTNPDEAAAEHMVGVLAKAIKSKGQSCQIAVIEGVPSVPPLKARNEGLLKGAAQDGCTVLGKQIDTTGTVASAGTIASSFKSEFGSKLTGVIGYNDTEAEGFLPTLSSSYHPLVIGMNGEQAAVQAVEDGKMLADDGEQNTVMGEAQGYLAHLALNGKSVPPVIVSPYVLVTKADASKYISDDDYAKMPMGHLTFKSSGGQTLLVDSVGPFH